MKLTLAFLLMFISIGSFSQLVEKDTIHFGGVVFDENNQVLPNAHVLINSRRGVLTSNSGSFDLNVNVSDTLTISYIGFKRLEYIVPDTLRKMGYITGIFLKRDTLSLSEIIVLPWLSKDQFERAFIDNKHLEKNEANARANLSLLSANPGQKYSYMNQSGVEVQMAQFNNSQEYKGLVGPDDMVGMNVVSAIGLLVRAVTWNKVKEEQEEVVRNRLLRHKRILEQTKKPD